MKIAIIGFSGCGKSTLAKALSEKHGCDVLYLDTVHWLPGWKERPREEELTIVGDFLDTHSSWVIDGTYTKLHLDRRMEEADRIIFMCFNRFICFARAVKRYRAYKGKTRESMTDGCPERINFEFAKWLLIDGRTKKRKKKFYDIVEKYPEKSILIRNQRELDKFMETEKMI